MNFASWKQSARKGAERIIGTPGVLSTKEADPCMM